MVSKTLLRWNFIAARPRPDPDLEPVDDGAVLSQHGFQMAGNRKGQASDAIELRFRAIYDAPYASRRPKFADHAVESLIALIKSVIVQIRCQTILFMHVEVELALKKRRHPRGGEPHDFHLQCIANELTVEDALQVDARNISAAVWQYGHQVFGLQLKYRLTQGCSRYLKSLAESPLVYYASWRQRETDNGLTNGIVDLPCFR